jgi:hypothetical protein
MSIFLAEIHRSFALQLHYHGQRVQKHHHSDDRVEFLLGATQDPRGPKDPPKKNRTQLLDILQLYLVGGLPAPLKNMSSSVGMMKFPIYGKIKFMFQTTNQILAYSPFNHWVAAPLVQ